MKKILIGYNPFVIVTESLHFSYASFSFYLPSFAVVIATAVVDGCIVVTESTGKGTFSQM